MAISTVDTNAILREYLITSGTDLYTLCGTRVYMNRIPEQEFTNASPGLLARVTGGTVDYSVPVQRPTYQIRCYGGTTSGEMRDSDAMQVARALADVLKSAEMKTVTSGTILYAEQVTANQPLVDPDTGWPFVLVQYQVACMATGA